MNKKFDFAFLAAVVVGFFCYLPVLGQAIYNPTNAPQIPYLSQVTTIKNNLEVHGEAAFCFGPFDIVQGAYGSTLNAWFNPSGVINGQFNQLATGANTTPTTGHTYTLPLNSLAYTGEAIRIRVWGVTGATVNNKTVTLAFGGQTVYTSGAVAANATPYYIEATIFQTSLGNQTALVQGTFNNVPLTVAQSRVTLTLPTTTTNEAITTTLTNGTAAAADITENGFVVDAVP